MQYLPIKPVRPSCRLIQNTRRNDIPNAAHPECFPNGTCPNGKMYRRVLVHLFITILTLLLTITTQANKQQESPETALRNYLTINWPGAKLDDKEVTNLLDTFAYVPENPFWFYHDKTSPYYCFVPQDNYSINDLQLRAWWEKKQLANQKADSPDNFFSADCDKDQQNRPLIKNIYKIYLMPPCKKNGVFYNVDQAQALTMLITIFDLLATDKKFRQAIGYFKFQDELRYITSDHPTPFFVLYVLNGKKNAQLALNTLVKKLPFKQSNNGTIYLEPPYTIPVDTKKYPGLCYTQGDREFTNKTIKWRDLVYDKTHNYALFNPKFVEVKDSRELMLNPPNKKSLSY